MVIAFGLLMAASAPLSRIVKDFRGGRARRALEFQ